MLKYIKELLEFAGPYKKDIQKAYVPTFLKSVLTQMIIFYSYYMVLKIYKGEYKPIDSVVIGVVVIATVLFEAVLQNMSDRSQSAAGYMIMAEKRKKLGEHLRKMPMGFFTEGNIGKISTVLATDMTFIEQAGMNAVAMTLTELFNIIVMVIFAFIIDWRMGGIVLAVTLLVSCAGRGIMKNSELESSIKQEQNEILTSGVIEFTEGIGIIKAFNIMGEKSENLNQIFADSTRKSINFEKKYTPWNLLIDSLTALGTVVVLAGGFYLYFKDVIKVELLFGVLLFVFQVFAPLKSYYADSARFGMIESSLKRINDLFRETEIEDKGKGVIPTTSDYEIEFDKVSFSYGDHEVLHNISFNVKKNEMLALVGASGGGKSTIANLIARLWDVDSGAVKIRGVDIRTVPMSELMKHISMVFQRVYLFKDTIYNNIIMGRPDATQEEVIEAAKKARCYDFIMSLPERFDTVVEEGGVSLSGGERQRISIARCILKDAPIIILDESTASVDVDNESYIQEAIGELCKDKTIVVIAHRLNTIVDADKIMVISEGNIAESGNHSELINKNGIYAKMVESRNNTKGWY